MKLFSSGIDTSLAEPAFVTAAP